MEFIIFTALWLSTIAIGVAGTRLNDRAIWFLSFLSVLGVGGFTLYVLQSYVGTGRETIAQTTIEHGIFPLTLGLVVNEITLFLIAFAMVLTFVIYTFSAPSILREQATKHYCLSVNLFLSVWVFMVASTSLFQVILAGTTIGFLSYIMATMHHNQQGDKSAAERIFYVHRVGDILFMFVMAGLFALYNTTDIQTITQAGKGELGAINSPYVTIIMIIFAVSVAIQTGQLLFHFAPSDTAESPASLVSLSLGAGMGLFAVYMVMQLHPLLVQSPMVMQGLHWWVVISLIYGAGRSVLQFRIRRAMADLMTLQLGLLLLATLNKGAEGFYEHLPMYMASQILLYMFIRLVMFLTANEYDMRAMGGLYKRGAVTSIVALAYTLTATGVAFWLWGVPTGLVSAGDNVWLIALIALVNALAVVRFVSYTFLGQCRMGEQASAYISENYSMAVLSIVYGGVAVVLWGLFLDSTLFEHTTPTILQDSVLLGIMAGATLAGLSIPSKSDTGIPPIITPNEPVWVTAIRHGNLGVSSLLWRTLERPLIYRKQTQGRGELHHRIQQIFAPLSQGYIPMVITVVLFAILLAYGGIA